MIIVIEGIDRVGKTTLCEMIRERYIDTVDFRRFKDNTRYAHGHNDEMVNTEKNNTVVSMIEEGIVDNIILDRFHITEFVYGAIERSYKNMDMYDIDRRLSVIGGPDHPVTEPDDLDNIDSAMMVDGIYHTPVVLIYMVPVDIRRSSAEHGYNLERHLKWFDDFYSNTMIKDKIKIDYKTMDLALDFIDDILGIVDEDEEEGQEPEPEIPEEPEGSEEAQGDDGNMDNGTTLQSVIKNSRFFNRAN